MATWPGTLPQSPFLGVSDKRNKAVARTEMDTGPPKMRRRFTAAVREIDVGMFLTGAQRTTFDTFFITTLKEGALSFDWTDPNDGATASMRFREPPAWQQIRAGSPDAKLWQSSLKLEILP